MNASSIPLEEILLDPSAVFDSPKDVIDSPHLNEEEKSEVLRSWEEDAEALLRAETEAMDAPEKPSVASELLAEISNIRLEFEKRREDRNDS